MAEMWYYTCEGKQMDPVSIRDLKRLAGDGVLKPTDMVWKDGLPRWIRASSMKELFPDPSAALDQYFSRPTAAAAAARSEPPSRADMPAAKTSSRPRPDAEEEPRPTRRRRRSADEDDEDRPRRRRPVPSSGGSGTLILIGFLAGGFVILGSLVIGIIILAAPRNPPLPRARMAAMARPQEIQGVQPDLPPRADPPVKLGKDDPPVPDGIKSGNGVLPITVRLAPGAEHIVKFRVQGGHAAKITVTPLPIQGKVVDLNMQVFRDSDNALVIADETPSPSARVAFTLPATEIVRVRIHNASKRATVTQFTLVYDLGN